MYRLQNRYKNIFVALFNVLFVLFCFFGSSFAFEVPLWDMLDRFYENAERNLETNSLNGKAIVEDIYDKSLSVVQNNQVLPMMDAMDKTVSYINQEKACQIDKLDVINVLYFSSDSLRKNIKTNLNDFEKPSRSDMWASCNKINICVYDPVWWVLKNSVTLNQECQRYVKWIYLDFFVNEYYMYSVDEWNKWSNLFYNLSLDDSSYDILNDVYVLSKILFQDVEKPQEIYFYKMPDVNYNSIYQPPEISMDIDWFSPYNNFTASWSGQDLVDTWTQSEDLMQESNMSWDENLDEISDPEIQDFVESINSNTYSNPDSVVFGNQCVEANEFLWFSGTIESVDTWNSLSPEEYLDTIISDVAELSCNKDGQCQVWESSDCSDCINSSSGSTDIEEIEQLLNQAEQNQDDIDPNDPVLWCFQKCQHVTCNPTNCEKLTCYAKCACKTYESPVFDPSTFPGLTSAFKLKFCIVPVMENNIVDDKIVYNIASVFTEIYNVLQNLRNSGQMAVNVKTKEFLDSSLKKNNFADQLSFSINSTKKPVFSQESELTQTEEQIEFNTSLMKNILWFGKDLNLETEQNKYVVMDDPCSYGDEWSVKSDCQQKRSSAVEMIPDLEEGLKNAKVVLLDAEFEKFLSMNVDFWYQVSSMFEQFEDTAKNLNNKR